MTSNNETLDTLVNPCDDCKFLRRIVCVTGCREYNRYLFRQELKSQYRNVADAALDNTFSCEDFDREGYYK